MMETLTQLLARLANWKTIAILILIALPFNLVIFPMRSARLKELAGKSTPIIDVMFAYTPAQVYELVPAYGEQGRQLYALTELTADLVYPIIYNSLLSLLMAIIFRGAFSSGSKLHKLPLLPLASWLADYLENVGITTILSSYPQELDAVAWVTSFFSTVKWTVCGASAAMIVIGLVVLLVKKIKT
jgi:hypothetical protein